MGIVDFFRPKYRHRDVKVRLEAVRALSSDESAILASIARTDKDPGVRRVAIEKLDDVEVLAELAQGGDDRGLREFAGARAAALWVVSACQGEDEVLAATALAGLVRLGDQRALAEVAGRAAVREVRSRAQAELRDPRALADLARAATSPEVRQAALARLDDVDVLRALAMDSTVKELGLLAVDKLTQKDSLEPIALKAKAKAVRQRARKKLDDIAESEAAQRPRESDDLLRRRAEKSQLLRAIEALGETFEWQNSLTMVRAAEATWATLGDTDEPGIDERFGRGVSRYHTRRTTSERQVQDRSTGALAEVRTRRDADLRVAEARASQDRDEEDDDIVNPAVILAPALTDEQRAERDRAAAERDRVAAERREVRDRERLDEQARRDLDATARASRQKEAAERGAQIALSLGALLDEMAALLESSDGKSIDRLLGQAATAFSQIAKIAPAERAPLEARYGAVRAKLIIALKELRESEDWKRWAAVPRAEALIAEARSLAEGESVPALPLLKDLQQRWKLVGHLPQKRSQELWEQFKTVSDAAFARIKSGREAEQQKFVENIKIKEQLVVQATALSDSTEWEATALALKDLQKQWKESGPLPRREADDLWKRFRAACDRFFERRKPLLDAQFAELRDNQARKEELIDRAEAVLARGPDEGGWGKALSDIKAWQREWKEIGRVPRSEVETLWRRFRAACDGVFAKRDAARDGDAEARRVELGDLRKEIEAVSAGGEQVAQRALVVRDKVRAMIERDVAPGVELRALYDAMLESVIANHGDGLRGTDLDPVAMTAHRDRLVSQAEALLPKAAPTLSSEVTATELAERLRNAMAANALFRADQRDPFEVIAELRDAWRAVGPVVGAAAEAQAAQFVDLCERVIAGHGGQSSSALRRDAGDRDEGYPRRRDRRDRQRGDARSLGLGTQPPVVAREPAVAEPPLEVDEAAAPPASNLPDSPLEAGVPNPGGTGEWERPRQRSATIPVVPDPKEMDPVDSGWE